MIGSLPSHWRGTVFRSRTEARWAVFFDAIKLRWEYEPEGFRLGDGTMYLPDFWLPEMRAWAEVKGVEPTPVERSKIEMLVTSSGSRCIVLDGAPWPKAYEVCWPDPVLPHGFEWMHSHFSDRYTVGLRDGDPRMFDACDPDYVPEDEWVAEAMATARRMDVKDAEAGDYLPAGWEGIEIVWDEPIDDPSALDVLRELAGPGKESA